MSSNSPSPENDPRRSNRFIAPDSGLSKTPQPSKEGDLAFPASAQDATSELAREVFRSTPLEPWQERLVVMRAAAFQATVTSLLERAGDLILFPSGHDVFQDGQEENVERYMDLRDDFRELYESLIERYAEGIQNLPVALRGLNTNDVDGARIQAVFEGEVFGKLEDLKLLCTQAVSLHKEVFDEALRERRKNAELESGIEEGELLDRDSVEETRDAEFQAWDCELQAVSNTCDWLSHYFSNPDEGAATCNLHDFLHDKARALTIEGDIDRSASITAKLSGLTALLQQSAHLLDGARSNALDEWRLDGRNGKPCSKRELVMLQDASEAPLCLRVDEDRISQRSLLSLEIYYPLDDSLKPSYQKAYETLESYFDALRPYAKQQGVGIAIRKDRPSIVLYIFKDNGAETRQVTRMGPYARQDGVEFEESNEGAEGNKITRCDPRAIEDRVLSVSPRHKRAIFIDFAHAALASDLSLRNFQAVRNLIHDWTDIEGGFVTASAMTFSSAGSGDGVGLQQKREGNRYQLSLTSIPEQSPNFKLEKRRHPLSWALPCDEEREAAVRGPEPHIFGPTLTKDRTRRCMIVEPGACNHPAVLQPVKAILRQAHPLFLSVSARTNDGDNEAELYGTLARELNELADILRKIRADYGCRKLYLAQLEPEQEYPGCEDIFAVYNIYHSRGFLVSRVYLQKTSDKDEPFKLVERRLDGRDLRRAEKEVLTVLASCDEEFRLTHTDLRQHFADRNIFLCDTLLQEICAASVPSHDHGAESVVAKFFLGSSVWIERELHPDDGPRLYVLSQREREYR